jgi:hypothetical protein
MRVLTLIAMRCLERPIDDGGERSLADSGERPRKGTVKFIVPRPTLDAISLPEDLMDGALLLDHLKNSGVVCSGGAIDELR